MNRGRVDVVQPSSVRSGGMREITRIGQAAFRRGLLCVPHAWCHVVGVAAEIHLAAVLPNTPYFETPLAFPDSPIISELLDPHPELDENGQFTVPKRPGLGLRAEPGGCGQISGGSVLMPPAEGGKCGEEEGRRERV